MIYSSFFSILKWRGVLTIVSILFLLAGLYFMQSGFLLRRNALNLKSSCDRFPIFPTSSPPLNFNVSLLDKQNECWLPKPFPHLRRVVWIIIDALRYDFVEWLEPKDLLELAEQDQKILLYRNRLTHLHAPKQGFARLFRSKVDPPTTTYQRLKGMTTGNLPTFIEMGSNFHSQEVQEDSLFYQLVTAHSIPHSVSFMGDDTWMGLYSRFFKHAWPYPSFDVWDLHTVDNGVLTHIFQEIQNPNLTLVIGHFLGVDHVGHRYAPTHLAMQDKLDQMNHVLQQMMSVLPEDTLLIVAGDHGMDPKGDHGGDSFLETTAALWMYSKTDIFANDVHSKVVNQIDFLPTLSFLLGLPIPFENLGQCIPDVIPSSLRASAQYINAAQIRHYISLVQHPELQSLLDSINEFESNTVDWMKTSLEKCREIWAQFDLTSMYIGLFLLLCSFLSLSWITLFHPPFISQLLPLSTVFLYFSNSFILFESAMMHYLLQTWFAFKHGHQAWFWMILNWLAYQVRVCREENKACVSTWSHPGLLSLYSLSLLSLCTTWVTRFNFLLLKFYWLIEEEYLLIPRSWSVLLAQLHFTWILLSFALRWIPFRLATFFWLAQLHRPASSLALTLLYWYPNVPALVSSFFSRISNRSTCLVARFDSREKSIDILRRKPNEEEKEETRKNESKEPQIKENAIDLIGTHLLLRTVFFNTGHQATLSSIQWTSGFVGLTSLQFYISGFFVVLNSLGHILLARPHQLSSLLNFEIWHVFSSSIAAWHLRRHLMIWSIFAPRWMLSVLICGSVLITAFMYAVKSIYLTMIHLLRVKKNKRKV